MNLDLEQLRREIVREVAAEVVSRMREELDAASPWLAKPDAITYSALKPGNFNKWVADGRIPAHGGKRDQVFHKAEIDRALGFVPPEPAGISKLKAA